MSRGNSGTFGNSLATSMDRNARQALDAASTRQYIQGDYKKLEPQSQLSSTTTIGVQRQPGMTAQQYDIMSDSRRGVYQKIYSLQQQAHGLANRSPAQAVHHHVPMQTIKPTMQPGLQIMTQLQPTLNSGPPTMANKNAPITLLPQSNEATQANPIYH